jgi:DNA helicase-2/ATP-dependent DNA helicase PcrA
VSHNKNSKKARTAHQGPQRQKTLAEMVAQSAPSKLAALAVGDRVSHPQFGVGTIIAVEASKLSIAFDSLGQKQIIDSYVKRLKK